MPRRPLLVITLALLLLGSAHAEGDATENVAPPFSVLSNTTLTCSARLPTAVVGCYVERPLFVLGPVELAIGVDAQAVLHTCVHEHGCVGTHVAPYAVLAIYQERWSAWAELRLPEIHGLHPIGDPDWLRAGFSVRF